MSHHWLQVVNDHYSGWGDQQLVDDLLTFFCTNGTTKRLWKQLADRIGNTQRASKQTKRATKKAFTGSDAVRLILDLQMPKQRYVAQCAHAYKWFNGVQRGSTVRLNPYHK